MGTKESMMYTMSEDSEQEIRTHGIQVHHIKHRYMSTRYMVHVSGIDIRTVVRAQ